MSTNTLRDPYNGFKSDEARRQALATRERWQAAATIIKTLAAVISALLLTPAPPEWLARLTAGIGAL